jgi:selenocysteine lyase/cysteine desulfurase
MSSFPLPRLVPSAPVPLVDGRSTDYANLDGAATAAPLQAVADRVAEVLPYYASVHRGAGWHSQVSTTLYEEARRGIAAYVGARSDDVAVITRNTTDALNLLAGAVPGRTLVLDVEHHANLLPWREGPGGATVLSAPPTVAETLVLLGAELERASYALVAVTGASNVTGEALPLPQVVALAHRAGARVVVDGAQLLPHRRFSLTDSGVDYVAFSGHKLYAPYGAGVLVGRRDWLDAAPAYLAGGGAVRRVHSSSVDWAPTPARHEGGTPNLVGAVALAAATEAIGAVPEDVLVAHEQRLLGRLQDGLGSLDGVQALRIWADSTDSVGIVSFAIADQDPGLVATYLSAEHGVGVRDGLFCAHPLLRRLGHAGGALRASVGLGTTDEHVDRLVHGLGTYLAAGPRRSYAVLDGAWTVAEDARPVPGVTAADVLVPTAGCGVPE